MDFAEELAGLVLFYGFFFLVLLAAGVAVSHLWVPALLLVAVAGWRLWMERRERPGVANLLVVLFLLLTGLSPLLLIFAPWFW